MALLTWPHVAKRKHSRNNIILVQLFCMLFQIFGYNLHLLAHLVSSGAHYRPPGGRCRRQRTPHQRPVAILAEKIKP